MKMKTLALLAGASGSLLIAGTAEAGFTGLSADILSGASVNAALGVDAIAGLSGVIRVYANFSDVSPNDHMIAVAGTSLFAMNIFVTGGGTFYQDAGGGNVAPSAFITGIVPSAAFDTFGTIGELTHGGTAVTGLSPGFPGFGASSITGTNVAWFVTPDDAVGAPVGGRVLIGQFAILNGSGLDFSARLTFVTDGDGAGSQNISAQFFPIPAPGALALLGMAGLVGGPRRRRRG